MTTIVLTIDGPSGAGKGTVSRAIACRLGWHYLDSGSIYRALAIQVLKQHIAVTDIDAIVMAAQKMQLEFSGSDTLKVMLNGLDITPDLATEITGHTASVIATYPQIRTALLQKQKAFKQPPGLVADGRDMGTVVFPEADYKIFLTASTSERAKRRYKQLIEKGIDANLSKITEQIESRDRRDRERSTAPLQMADDALYIDSSDLSIEQVIMTVIDWINQ